MTEIIFEVPKKNGDVSRGREVEMGNVKVIKNKMKSHPVRSISKHVDGFRQFKIISRANDFTFNIVRATLHEK